MYSTNFKDTPPEHIASHLDDGLLERARREPQYRPRAGIVVLWMSANTLFRRGCLGCLGC